MKITEYEIDGINPKDFPDFCDAYLSYAEDENGEVLTDYERETWVQKNYEEFNDMILQNLAGLNF